MILYSLYYFCKVKPVKDDSLSPERLHLKRQIVQTPQQQTSTSSRLMCSTSNAYNHENFVSESK